nr:uncharacterized protein LOC111986543 isoform X2 [Quercus suber]XP_023873973.1 uncharacterized protein LOC111986543 isoform X2 [Quercus suber]
MENDVVCYEAQLPILFVEFMHGLPLINSGCRYCIDYLVQSGRVESTMLISELTTSSSPPPPPPPSSLSPSKKKCRNWFYFCFGVEIENLGFLNTDVPFNALSCFPTKILLGLKCVSKGWHQLIFDRSFIQAQLQKQKPIVSGFIFQGKYQWGNEDIETVSYIPAVESEDEGKGGEQCCKR